MTNVSQAYLKLNQLARNSRQHAQGLPEQEQTRAFWSGVGFTLNGLNFVAPMNEVSEILVVPRYTQVPGVQGWVRGIANVRGRLMPVMDLMAFLNLPSQLQLKRRRLLAIERGEMYSGLVVDEVTGMQHFPQDMFTDAVPSAYDDIGTYVRGGFESERGFWAWFSLSDLAQDPKFLSVAS